ncbi:PAS domain S-box protein [Archangium violaceum]|uniref:sensor histidine kinase n=1 Tax=Archangium violaceum TaxID=83451 RepID=UPI00194ECAAB|nr:ATP-binding protein [Archangium violaceum]QRN98786.1 PAS domain S-box protein [Archangium violaceum]
MLVVDDSRSDRLMAIRVLRRAFPGCVLEEVEDEARWRQVLTGPRFDAAIIDYRLPWADGMELLQSIQRRWPGVPVLMLSGTADENQALEAVQEGLEEYLPKTAGSYALLPRSVRFALERARQRQALIEANETLHLVIEGVRGHAIFLVDPEGRVLTWNAGAQAITGYREEEVVGRFVRPLLVPEASPGERLGREVEEAVRRGVYTGEGWRLRKGGGRFWADISVSALHGEGGAPRGFVVVLRDVSERKRLEEERRQASEFRERLLGIVSHDLRSPLQAILLQSQLLPRDVRPEPVMRATSRISQAAERMGRMIADLLDFTRGRLGGGIPVERVPGDLLVLVREVTEELRLAHPHRRISFVAMGEGHGEWDKDRLTQVVQNLVSNALKHGAEDVPVRVEMQGEEDPVVLSIHNEGRPIPPELMLHLFDPFRRGKDAGASDRLTTGLGLGLYIVQEIVHAHGGTIHVTSSAEAGTCFTVRLPRRPLVAVSPR